MSSRRIVDLSAALDGNPNNEPAGYVPEVNYIDHQQSVVELQTFFPGLQKADLPDGEGWAIERISLTTHNGTHMDAPYHYATTMDGGERAITIDEIPLDWCIQPGVKLDFRHYDDGYVVTADDLQRELDKIGHELQPLEIVLTNTRAGERFGLPDYRSAGCGFGREATLFLTERGVKVVGTDAWSWDAPFVHTAQRYAKEGDPSIIWEGHKAGRDAAYCQLEKLQRLDELPATGFVVSCLPVKIKAASAGWIRAVAIFDGDAP